MNGILNRSFFPSPLGENAFGTKGAVIEAMRVSRHPNSEITIKVTATESLVLNNCEGFCVRMVSVALGGLNTHCQVASGSPLAGTDASVN